MPAPSGPTWTTARLVSVHTDVLTDIDAGTAGGKIRLFSEADLLLCEVTLTDPGGSVNGTTGQLTLTPAGPGTAVADGDCTWGTITDSDDTLILSLPAQQGGAPVSGYIVLNSTSILLGAEVTVSSATIG